MKVRTYTLLLLTLLSISVVIYAPVLKTGFFLDDDYLITNNPHIRQLSNAPEFFVNRATMASTVWPDPLYRPVRTLWWAILHALFGANPFAFHIAGLFLHMLNSILLMVLISALFDKKENTSLPAFAGAVLFFLHPSNVETVSWISAQGVLLALLFCLLALLVGIKSNGYLGAITSGIFYLCGSFSYENAVVLPLFFMVIVFVQGGFSLLKENKKFLLSFGVALLIYLLFRGIAVGYYKHPPVWGKSMGYHLSVFSCSLLISLKNILFPVSTKFIYVPTLWQKWLEIRSLMTLASGIGLLIIVAFFIKKRSQWALASSAWLFFYLPTSNLLPATWIFGDRFVYLSNIAIAFVVFIIFSKLNKKMLSLALLVGLSYGLLSYKKVGTWQDIDRLWLETAKHYSPLMRMGETVDRRIELLRVRSLLAVAQWHIKKGRFKYAVNELREALKADPTDFYVYFNLGVTLANLGEHEEAVKAYREALKLGSPRPEENFAVYDNLANSLTSVGKYEEASKEYRQALTLNPASFVTHTNYASALMALKKYEEAEKELQIALTINPHYEPAIVNLSAVYLTSGKDKEAVTLLEKSLNDNPRSILIAKNLAVAYLKMGDKEKARSTLEYLLKIYPELANSPFYKEFLTELDK